MTRSHVTILLILGRGGLLLATARRGGALLHTPRDVVAVLLVNRTIRTEGALLLQYNR